ncbi:MAG: hypothetical protein IJD22_05890 [Clostridia bacterium]|nr:hypothetical protein [Clostridia bacterium]
MKNIEKKVKKEKALNRNAYSLSNGAFRLLWFASIGAVAASLAEPFLMTLGTATSFIIMGAVTLFVTVVGLIFTFPQKGVLVPYSRKEGFNFIGLHNLTKENLGSRAKDVLSRNEEVRCIHDLLENVIFPQSDIKQAICITGKSGCGKSTILAFFQQKYEGEYEIHNFSGNYNSLRATLEQQFDTCNIDMRIRELSGENRKIVFIFDQFERYFYLSEERQLDVRKFIASLCMKNTAIIASMREEFLAEFLREFDLNDIKSNMKTNDEVEHRGLLRRLVGYIKDSENYVVINGSRRRITLSRWKSDNIKSPEFLHVSDPEGKRAVIDKTDATIFYCENQNKMKVNAGGQTQASSMMLGKCEEKFGTDVGRDLYALYFDKPLIEQQIIFHMAEFDAAVREGASSAEEFCSMDTHDIIKRYFDIQLSSTGDYFNASRIMYMLSSSRLHQISMKTKEIVEGLRANQFSPKGKKAVSRVIAQLEELQLIRKNSSNSDAEYEIAHDYIATAFLNYSRANMDRNVKAALDIFLADFIEDFERNLTLQNSNVPGASRRKKAPEKRNDPEKDRFYTVATVVACVLCLVTDVIFRFVWNPWETVWSGANPMQGVFPIFIPIHIMLSIVYFYQLYDKVFKYYNGKNNAFLKVEYIGMVLVAVLCEALYPHFVITDGLGLVVVGATACLILDRDYREASRAALNSYGIKCVVVGFAFALAHVLFYISQGEFPVFLIVFEMAAETLLVGYAHFSHMTREYLYGRCMDVSGNKIR